RAVVERPNDEKAAEQGCQYWRHSDGGNLSIESLDPPQSASDGDDVSVRHGDKIRKFEGGLGRVAPEIMKYRSLAGNRPTRGLRSGPIAGQRLGPKNGGFELR